MFSGTGEPLIPVGGSLVSFLKSRISLCEGEGGEERKSSTLRQLGPGFRRREGLRCPAYLPRWGRHGGFRSPLSLEYTLDCPPLVISEKGGKHKTTQIFPIQQKNGNLNNAAILNGS